MMTNICKRTATESSKL
uniref:Uncharacterized protein n=1 Tax=Arundo donax TaxID=35708 RepID=A0A0A9AMX1_ARUDO